MIGHFLILFICVCVNQAQEDPVIETAYGAVRGSVKYSKDQVFEEYLGIPYAAPPIGDNRWRKPQPPEPWDDVRDAKEIGASCIQFLSDRRDMNDTSEDCLYLNIYVPGTNRAGDDLAVMVWVHGGAFFFGAGDSYPAYDLALHGDVIVVTFNYRLGPLGFLSTEDDAAPGNYGLWDVRQTFQWVQENIAAFGGDVTRVTAFGHSAGGATVSHCMISPEMKGLFARGIALSGQSSGGFGVALPGKLRETTELLATFVGCRRINDSYELVECLREVPAQDLARWGFIAPVTVLQQLPNFIPVIDGEFVMQRPEDSWYEGASADMDYMIGRLEHDGQFAVTGNLKGLPEDLVNFAANTTLLDIWLHFQFAHFPDTEAGVAAIYEAYPLLKDDDAEIRTIEATEMATDFWFYTYTHVEASQHSNNANNTFMYNFKYRQSFVQYPNEWLLGSHGDELYSIFGYNFSKDVRDEELGADFTEPDYYVSDLVMTYFTNFANSGNPNEGSPVELEWPSYNRDTKLYLEISDAPVSLNESSEMLDKVHFWHHDFVDIVMPVDYEEGLYMKNININKKLDFFEDILDSMDTSMLDILAQIYDVEELQFFIEEEMQYTAA